VALNKTSRWAIRGGLLLVAAILAASFFRYTYTSDKSVRVDRFTGEGSRCLSERSE